MTLGEIRPQVGQSVTHVLQPFIKYAKPRWWANNQ